MAQGLSQATIGIKAALDRGDEDTALRWLVQFADDFKASDHDARAAMVKDEPPSTARREWDALVAGVVEWLSQRYGLRMPAWCAAPERFLDQWWFLPHKASLRALVFTETPAALANRGVFVSRTAFESV